MILVMRRLYLLGMSGVIVFGPPMMEFGPHLAQFPSKGQVVLCVNGVKTQSDPSLQSLNQDQRFGNK